MINVRSFASVLAALFLLTQSALARPLGTDEAAALESAVSRYLQAISAGDAETIVTGLPPRILNVYAGTTGIEAKKLESTLIEQTAELMKGTKVSNLGSDQRDLDASDEVLADGSTVTWVLVPTVYQTVSKGARARSEQPLLAVNEAGTWYFLRIDGPDRQALAALAYPFLADITFPPSTVTPLN